MACNWPSTWLLNPLKVVLMAVIAMSTYTSCTAENNKKTYIVQTMHSSMPAIFESPVNWYTSTLASMREQASNASPDMVDANLPKSEDDSSILIYTYRVAAQGFAAWLTEQEAESLKNEPGFLSVIPDKLYKLQTTRTPEFLGLSQHAGLWPKASFGKDVIIGVIDTGVWPESASFDDGQMSPVPKRWKGHCVDAVDFKSSLCNKKLIGAKYFLSTVDADADLDQARSSTETVHRERKSPRDPRGHGTHTASTAAGSHVANASFFGYAKGTAKGMAPGARIAAYKACWESLGGCMGADLLAAMDEAISDGVDVISLSLGGSSGPFYEDPLAIGSFGALDHGILVSCAAGNSGPSPSSILNNAPWLLTVAASTIDRSFPATVQLGNGDVRVGQSLYTGEKPKPEMFPLVSMGLCNENSLETQNVEGKIVICQQHQQQQQRLVAVAGGEAEILVQPKEIGHAVTSSSFLLPTINVNADDGAAIRRYAGKTAKVGSRRKSEINHSHATAVISLNGTRFGNQRAPAIAGFSSRGPNSIVPSILKPDVAAPGVNILAAWGGSPPSSDPSDDRKTGFNIISGTSMACPHVTGLVALLQAAHPNWSPAAIKSALMTTARTSDNRGKPILDDYKETAATPFDYGAGHVDPNAALDPGLVYDISVQDYIDLLCSLGYEEDELLLFTRGKYKCSDRFEEIDEGRHLNYPAFAVVFNEGSKRKTVKLRREVTNVGAAPSVYKAEIEKPAGIDVKVVPATLSFSAKAEKQTFELEISDTKNAGDSDRFTSSRSTFGLLTWVETHNLYRVGSPIAVTWS